MTLTLIRGPAGGGKSNTAAELLAAKVITVLSDVTRLWVALSGVERDPVTGLYPERLASDPALQTALYIQKVAVRQALEAGENVGVTSSAPDTVERWQAVADDADVPLTVRTIDPGLQVVRERLSGPDGILSSQCARAISRWFG